MRYSHLLLQSIQRLALLELRVLMVMRQVLVHFPSAVLKPACKTDFDFVVQDHVRTVSKIVDVISDNSKIYRSFTLLGQLTFFDLRLLLFLSFDFPLVLGVPVGFLLVIWEK